MGLSIGGAMDRRQAALTTFSSTFVSSSAVPSSSGLLENRVSENTLTSPPYGMDGNDVYYPDWFLGTWTVKSECTNVQAPCGIPLFGGNATYDRAQAEILQKPLVYSSRFIQSEDSVIADREFNVKSFAAVALGINSVVNVAVSNPNKLSCLLALGSGDTGGGVFQVDLLTLQRCQEKRDDTHFDCSEVAQEIVSDPSRTTTRPRLLKQVETTSLYTFDNVSKKISCRQRSATFLLPSQQDPVALQMWQATRGRPVDVRFYNVAYEKK